MLTQKNKIIIVDDQEDELYRLGKAFLNIGVGCKTILYDMGYVGDPYEYVRIAFFDINLTLAKELLSTDDIDDILKNHSQVFNDLVNAINQYISLENGPYALIFWTKNEILVEAFVKYVRDRDIKIANPILISTFDKTRFTESNLEGLINEVSRLLSSEERIKFLFDIEEAGRKAGENTLNRLYDILPKDTVFGKSEIFMKNLDLILSKIAMSTLGYEHSKENPKKAIYEGLLPIISYEFLNRESIIDYESIVESLKKSTKFKDVVFSDNKVISKLNSLYHIEYDTSINKDVRGCVFEVDKSNKDFLSSLGIDDIKSWINSLIPIKDSIKNKSGYIDSKTLRGDEILNSTKLIAVELSASCDFSNKKPRINKYILGIITLGIDDIEKELNLKGRSESSYHLGGCSFDYNEDIAQIWLNLNYVFGFKSDNANFGETLFTLKKEIMDMLGNKYASHISRIGITSI
ncbi:MULTISPECIES: hypothetical protein [unclassified Empedobacter]|uniref:hypothetical protein n=1 Tax=unclassified Empedobacter TaxID=2643773 RepID=UPI0025C43352|nr:MULTISPECIES: hypothetical protein [unclassified Empedobacter]